MEDRRISAARIRANNKYNKKAYDTIQVRARKEERIGELLTLGASQAGQSKAEYILDALKDRLQGDGITIESLPPISE